MNKMFSQNFCFTRAPAKKIFNAKYKLKNSNLVLRVTDKNDAPCIYLSRGSFYISLSETEFFDLISSSKIREDVKNCAQSIEKSVGKVKYYLPDEKVDETSEIESSYHTNKIVDKVLACKLLSENGENSVSKLSAESCKRKAKSSTKNNKKKAKSPSPERFVEDFVEDVEDNS